MRTLKTGLVSLSITLAACASPPAVIEGTVQGLEVAPVADAFWYAVELVGGTLIGVVLADFDDACGRVSAHRAAEQAAYDAWMEDRDDDGLAAALEAAGANLPTNNWLTSIEFAADDAGPVGTYTLGDGAFLSLCRQEAALTYDVDSGDDWLSVGIGGSTCYASVGGSLTVTSYAEGEGMAGSLAADLAEAYREDGEPIVGEVTITFDLETECPAMADLSAGEDAAPPSEG